jgi:type IV secretory pathway VirB10-like protein
MAKKKIEKGGGARDTDSMSKSEARAYHKEICEFYEANGWRTTLSQYLLSPAQAGVIVKKTRDAMAKVAEKEKAAKAKARAAKKGAKAKAPSKKKAKAKAPSKKKAPPKPAKLKEKAAKTTKRKPAAKKKATKKVTKRKASALQTSATDEGLILDYLLAYRKGSDSPVFLDAVIADLAGRVRSA